MLLCQLCQHQPCQPEGRDEMICRVSLTTYMYVRGAGDAAGNVWLAGRCLLGKVFPSLGGIKADEYCPGQTKQPSPQSFPEYNKSWMIVPVTFESGEICLFPTPRKNSTQRRKGELGMYVACHALIPNNAHTLRTWYPDRMCTPPLSIKSLLLHPNYHPSFSRSQS